MESRKKALGHVLVTLLNNEQASDEYRTGAFALAQLLTEQEKAALLLLTRYGPLHGDQVPDAAEALACLDEWHLITVVCAQGQSGAWAATVMGWDVAQHLPTKGAC